MSFPLFISKIIDIVLAAGAVQGFFLALILTTNRNRKRTSNKILAALLLALSVSILHSILASPVFDGPYKIREPFILVIGPLLTFYIYELTGVRKITWKDAFHFIPFLLLILFILSLWSNHSSLYAQFLSTNGLAISKVIWTLIVFQFGYYWWNNITLLHIHRTAVETEFSNIEGKTLSWLKLFLHVFGGFLLLLLLTLVIAYHTNYYDAIDSIVCFGLSLSIFVLGYNGLLQEEVFSTAPSFSEIRQYEKSRPNKTGGAATVQHYEQLQNLTAYLESTKPYLNESLTLTELADQLNMTRNQLSALINGAFGENFYSFINKYRVEEVKKLIADPNKMKFTILSLAYEAGFPSKSSFHTIFKKFTGLTPTEYRNKLQ